MKRIVLFTFVLVLVLGLSGCWDMASQTKSGTVAVSVPGVGMDWVDPDHALAHDADVATGQSGTGIPSDYLSITGFGFAIPVDATILGVVVEVEKANELPTGVIDGGVRLVVGGAIGATNRGLTSCWPEVDTYVSHGSTTDLWGETLTPAVVNAANFGFAISVLYDGIMCRGYVNHVQMTVYYDSNRLRRRQLMNLTRTRPIAVQEIWP